MDELHAALRLRHCHGLGNGPIRAAAVAAGGLAALLAESAASQRALGLSAAQVAALAALDPGAYAADLDWAAGAANHLIPFGDPRYPTALQQLADPPVLLWLTGDPEVAATAQLAVVGSRHPSAGGRDNARDFAAGLAARGLCITSGLAAGVDAAAHDGALSAKGLTVAVVGTGLDRVYPAAHRALAHRIAAEGAIVSEFPIGTPPRAANFPRRNRLIAALSSGTLVVEATVRSGSLITARLALELGREVLAIPGSIHNPTARGCHALIRQGAKLVETIDDVLIELGPQLARPVAAAAPPAAAAAAPAERDPSYRQLLEQMGHDPVAVDRLVERTGERAEALASMLLLLELDGRVRAVGGGHYQRVATAGDGDCG